MAKKHNINYRLFFVLLIVPAILKAGDPGTWLARQMVLPTFLSSCGPIPPTFYPWSDNTYCNNTVKSAGEYATFRALRTMDSLLRGYTYDAAPNCGPLPPTAYPYGPPPYCTNNIQSAGEYAIWWYTVSIDSALSGGTGNLSGTLTPPHLVYASAVHTLSDMSWTYSAGNVTMPASTFMFGATGTFFTLNGSTGSMVTGFGSSQFSINPGISSFILQSSPTAYIEGTNAIGILINDSTRIRFEAPLVSIPQLGFQYQDGNQASGKVLTSDASGNATWQNAGMGGSGTTNYISKFTSATTLGNSLLFDNGTQLMLNTTVPSSYQFTQHIAANGDGYVIQDASGNNRNLFWVSSADNGALYMYNSSNTNTIIMDAGTGINYTSLNVTAAAFNSTPAGTYNVYNNAGSQVHAILYERGTDGGAMQLWNASTVPTVWADGTGNGVIEVGGNSPDASACLDLESTSQGMYLPQLTTTQILAMTPTPGKGGLLVWNTTTGRINVWDGTQWNYIVGVPGN
jgi:hypothetical protein